MDIDFIIDNSDIDVEVNNMTIARKSWALFLIIRLDCTWCSNWTYFCISVYLLSIASY